jgi:hypothetical protein
MEVQQKLADFTENKLSQSETRMVQQHIEQCPDCAALYQDFATVLPMLNNWQAEAPASLDKAFYAMLAQEKESSLKANPQTEPKIKPLWLYWQVAAAVVLVVAGFAAGRLSLWPAQQEIAQLKEEISETKNLVMLSMLKQGSASDRIKAVSYSYQMDKANQEILDALINTMLYDTNPNVQLEAINALSRFTNDASVRQALIKALRTQQDAILQITLIEILADIGEEDALPEMKRLMQDPEQPEVIRHTASEGVGQIYSL